MLLKMREPQVFRGTIREFVYFRLSGVPQLRLPTDFT
jgi:hypothetical protein